MNRKKPMLLAATTLSAGPAAAGASVIGIQFADHHFAPQTLTVPAGQPRAIKVVNASSETITVRLPALSPGSYDFYDDFHQDVPEGAIVAR